jgi:hypothetical protein
MLKEQGIVKMNSDTSDIIASIIEAPVARPKKIPRPFPTHYIEKVFYIWYNHGKPSAKMLIPYIPADLDEWGRVPNWSTVESWLEDFFVPRANALDAEVKAKLDALLISEKVDMLKRHADVGLKMQDMAIQYLNENRDEISAPAAVRLLVEGIRIERESRGIPAALDKMMNMSDEELTDELKKLMTTSSTLENFNADSR